MLSVLRDNILRFHNLRLGAKAAYPCIELVANLNLCGNSEVIVTIRTILRAKANAELVNYGINETIIETHYHFYLLSIIHGECAPDIGSNVRDSMCAANASYVQDLHIHHPINTISA